MPLLKLFQSRYFKIMGIFLSIFLFLPNTFASTFAPGETFNHTYTISNVGTCEVMLKSVTKNWNSVGGVLDKTMYKTGSFVSGENGNETYVINYPLAVGKSATTALTFYTKKGIGPGTVNSNISVVCDAPCGCNINIAPGVVSSISAPPMCGDGNVDPGEDCDDANQYEDDQCNNSCDFTYCGDSIIQTPNGLGQTEECDDGPDGSATCTAQCEIISDTRFCGDYNTDVDLGEECDDGPSGSATCTALCELIGGGDPICGDGITESPETCDDGNTISGDGCSATCQTEGGGRGSIGEKSIGTCTVHNSTGAIQCTPQKPTEDVDDFAWQEYRNCRNNPAMNEALCLINWANTHGYKICGGEVEGVIEVPYTKITTEDIIAQCAPTLSRGGSVICESNGCDGCFGSNSFVKKNVKKSDGNWGTETKITQENKAEYKVQLTLGTHDVVNYKILGGTIKLYDMTVPSESGNLWNRHEILDVSTLNDGSLVWQFVDGIDSDNLSDHFERTMSSAEIDQLNVGGYEFVLNYKMNPEFIATADIAKVKNVVWAVIEYTYKNQNTYETGNKIIGIGDNACTPNLYYSGSSLGSTATVHIIRPFLEAKKGGNLGFQFDQSVDKKLTGNRENIDVGNTNTTGKIFVEKDAKESGDQNFLFDFADSLIQKISSFDGIKKFQGESSRDTFFKNLKQNAFSVENILNKDWKTTYNNSGIYFLETEDLALNQTSPFDLENKNKTFILENGNLIIDQDFMAENGYAAFIIRKGNLIIDKTVEKIDGIFIVEKGKIQSKNNKLSSKQLVINGSFMGNMDNLLDNRIFIGTNPETKLEPNIEINFDLRLLENTPPGLEQFLGDDWQESLE